MDTNIEELNTKRKAIGQILVCALGCCCNRTDKGRPVVPVDWLKKEFKERRLLRHIQLTFTGCLGPCDLVNVVTIITPVETIWLGGLTEGWQFEALLDWSTKSAMLERLLPLPKSLIPYRFERWREPVLVEECKCCNAKTTEEITSVEGQNDWAY
jgi:hypothetical protein